MIKDILLQQSSSRYQSVNFDILTVHCQFIAMTDDILIKARINLDLIALSIKIHYTCLEDRMFKAIINSYFVVMDNPAYLSMNEVG